MVFEYAD